MLGLKLLHVCTRGHWSSNELHWLDQALGTIRRRITLCHSLWCPGGLMRQVHFWACAAAVIAHNLCSVNYAGALATAIWMKKLFPRGRKGTALWSELYWQDSLYPHTKKLLWVGWGGCYWFSLRPSVRPSVRTYVRTYVRTSVPHPVSAL